MFQGLGWSIVLLQSVAPRSGLVLAWVHAVALGWITLTALAVLQHVIPAMAEREWRFAALARASLAVIGAGALLLVAGFAASGVVLLDGALAAAAGIAVYVALALLSLTAPAPDAAARAIGRAVAATLCALLVTALLGCALAYGYVRGDASLLALAPVHAIIGIVLWLTALTAGVSVRTLVPMLGEGSRFRSLHIIAGSALFAGGIIAAAGAAFAPIRITGLAIVATGVIAYALDVGDRLGRASTPALHARLAVGAALAWLLVAAAASFAATSPDYARVAVVAALAGWIGSMVLAHLLHIGVRVLATAMLGDDDETRPWTLLSAPLAAGTVALYEGAVAALVIGSWNLAPIPLAVAGIAGLTALLLVAANGAVARGRARRLARAQGVR